jgi:flagellar hook-basal body complex protein FliE
MSSTIGASQFSEKILNTLREMQREANPSSAQSQGAKDGASFAEYLKEGVEEVNSQAVTADKMAMELATGQNGNIHETMLAATKSELSFNLMVQLRNKALEAYTEIMRMPV